MNGSNRWSGIVSYPVAYSVDTGDIVDIEDAPLEKGLVYSCIECGQRMAAVVDVVKRAPHFRHVDRGASCDADGALHRYAMEMIREGHTAASESGGAYWLNARDSRCEPSCGERPIRARLGAGWAVEFERVAIPGTRSDVVLGHGDGRLVIVEVVVTHDLEEETERAYRHAGVPFVRLWPSWESAKRLRDALNDGEGEGFGVAACSACARTQAKRQAATERLESLYPFGDDDRPVSDAVVVWHKGRRAIPRTFGSHEESRRLWRDWLRSRRNLP